MGYVSRSRGRRWLEGVAAPDEDHTFASCQSCEWKGWFKEGSDVPLGKVLALASERRF